MFLREPHTFIIHHIPPEGDILRDEEVRELGDSGEAGLVAALFEQGIRRMHGRFRRRLIRSLNRKLPVPVEEYEVETRIHDGALIVRVECLLGESESEEVNGTIADTVRRLWEKVANA